MGFFKRIFCGCEKTEHTNDVAISKIENEFDIPKGWYIQQAFQNPMHMLWDVVIVSFDDVVNHVEEPRHFIVTEKDTYQQALRECVAMVEIEEK